MLRWPIVLKPQEAGLVLDTGAAFSLVKTLGGLDILTSGGSGGVIIWQIYCEVMEDSVSGSYSENQLRFRNCYDPNSSSFIDAGFDMTQANHNRFASGNQLGDTSISIVVKKPEAFSLSNTDTINIVSNDRGLVTWLVHQKYGGPGNLQTGGASIGFVFENSDLAYQIY